MPVVDKIWSVLKRVPLLRRLHHYIVFRARPIFLRNRALFQGGRGLEIGGPSHIFGSDGALPIYPIVAELDNVNYHSRTFWSERDQDGVYRLGGRVVGQSLVLDSHEYGALPDDHYDVLLASHVIEHLANPIKILQQWRRVMRRGGVAVIIAPARRGTYDRKRAITTLDHLLQDYRGDVDETDSTHQDEVIALHDLSMDSTVNSLDAHIARTRANYENRIMHHHVFDERLLVETARAAGFQVQESAFIWPYHIVALLRKA